MANSIDGCRTCGYEIVNGVCACGAPACKNNVKNTDDIECKYEMDDGGDHILRVTIDNNVGGVVAVDTTANVPYNTANSSVNAASCA